VKKIAQNGAKADFLTESYKWLFADVEPQTFFK
jgi:hypothetical protein